MCLKLRLLLNQSIIKEFYTAIVLSFSNSPGDLISFMSKSLQYSHVANTMLTWREQQYFHISLYPETWEEIAFQRLSCFIKILLDW
jgi:hypothetical protein